MTLMTRVANPGQDCPICLSQDSNERFDHGNSHGGDSKICAPCLANWTVLQNKDTCPICRAQITINPFEGPGLFMSVTAGLVSKAIAAKAQAMILMLVLNCKETDKNWFRNPHDDQPPPGSGCGGSIIVGAALTPEIPAY